MIRETENLKPSEMRAVIRQLDEDGNKLRADLAAEQRAYKGLMLAMMEDDPEKAEDARQQADDMRAGLVKEELVVKPLTILLGLIFMAFGEFEVGLAITLFGGARIENEHGTRFYSIEFDDLVSKVKGFFKRG